MDFMHLSILAFAGGLVSGVLWHLGHRKPKNVKPGDNTWTTRDGRTMYITDMTDNHLKNAINYLERRIKCLQGWCILLILNPNSPSLRKDMVVLDERITKLQGWKAKLEAEAWRREVMK